MKVVRTVSESDWVDGTKYVAIDNYTRFTVLKYDVAGAAEVQGVISINQVKKYLKEMKQEELYLLAQGKHFEFINPSEDQDSSD